MKELDNLINEFGTEKKKLDCLKKKVDTLNKELKEHLVTNNISLFIGYSKDVIKSTGGSRKLTNPSNLYTNLVFEFMQLFDQTTDKDTPIRKVRNKF